MQAHPHLVVSISAHGFGHVALTAPVLNLLGRRHPKLAITVRSAVPLAHLKSRIQVPFVHLQSEGDIGMLMASALEVEVDKSRTAYLKFHSDWEHRVHEEAQLLRAMGADLVFSNVGYLPLAGAQRAGIRNVALCSLNWADIYRHYCGDDRIARQIHACYAGADAFLRATPGMAMNDPETGLANLVPVAPIADTGKNRRREIDRHLMLGGDEKLVLVSMGGVATRLPIENWPRLSQVRYLVPQAWHAQHPDAIAIESIPASFPELLASVDALLCKPGYGSFVEAACSGIPVLYVDRPDWPESPALTDWLTKNGVCCEVLRQEAERGEFAEPLQRIWQSRPVPVTAQGAAEAAAFLASRLY